MWTLAEAQKLIAELEPLVRELDYHTMLGGSVLHKGKSQKDLDLWFCPLNGYEHKPVEIYQLLTQSFGLLRSVRDHPDYKAGEPWHLREAYFGNYLGKRVDLFLL